VFATLPKLLERTGTDEHGTITAVYTVLVDGDDMNEPIADAVRGILDGHFVLDRKLAEQGQYHAINILKSVSRVMNHIVERRDLQAARELRRRLAVYEENNELILIGAYEHATNQQIAQAISFYPAIQVFLKQGILESPTYGEALQESHELMTGGAN